MARQLVEIASPCDGVRADMAMLILDDVFRSTVEWALGAASMCMHAIVMYAWSMKRFQMLLDDDLDKALRREARRRRTSKADLLRGYAREALHALPPLTADPIGAMVGNDDFEPADIDEIVYR